VPLRALWWEDGCCALPLQCHTRPSRLALKGSIWHVYTRRRSQLRRRELHSPPPPFLGPRSRASHPPTARLASCDAQSVRAAPAHMLLGPVVVRSVRVTVGPIRIVRGMGSTIGHLDRASVGWLGLPRDPKRNGCRLWRSSRLSWLRQPLVAIPDRAPLPRPAGGCFDGSRSRWLPVGCGRAAARSVTVQQHAGARAVAGGKIWIL
jgi:hypothetical protein